MSDATEQPERTGAGLLAESPASAHGDPATSEHRLEAARQAYGREVAALEAINEKAMRSVRTSVVILGFVSSAVGVAGPDAVGTLSVGVALSLALGVCALLAATLCGLGLLTATERPSGPGLSFRERPVGGEPNSPPATSRLLEEYEVMIRVVEETVDAHASGLTRVQRLLAAGIVSLSVAAGAFVLSEGYGVDGNVAAAGLGVAALVVASAGTDCCPVRTFAAE